MPITFPCLCGKRIRTADHLAGKRVRCPACETVTTVPVPEEPEILEVLPAGPPRKRSEITQDLPVARKEKKRPKLDREDFPEDRRPERRVVRRKSSSGDWTDKGVLAGLGMMLGAVVWFFGGLYAGRIFIYPPILFCIGLTCFIKGLIHGN